jgi:hypothetical protein
MLGYVSANGGQTAGKKAPLVPTAAHVSWLGTWPNSSLLWLRDELKLYTSVLAVVRLARSSCTM